MLYKGESRYRNFQCYLFLSPLYHSIQWNVLLWHKYTAQRSSHWSWNVSNNNPYIPRINPQALTPSQEYITPDTNQGWIYPLKSSQLPSFKPLLPWGSYWMTNEHWPGFKVKELRTGQYSTLIFFAIFYNQILMIYPPTLHIFIYNPPSVDPWASHTCYRSTSYVWNPHTQPQSKDKTGKYHFPKFYSTY